ncbi:MAG: enoyl-CoA hydratase-related protein, partial [Acidobacteriota bacterium]
GKITSNAPLALRYGVEAVNKSLETSREQGALLEASLFGQCCASEDMKEGTRAFLEKRAAKFQGT